MVSWFFECAFLDGGMSKCAFLDNSLSKCAFLGGSVFRCAFLHSSAVRMVWAIDSTSLTGPPAVDGYLEPRGCP